MSGEFDNRESLNFDDLTITLAFQDEPQVVQFEFEAGALWAFPYSLHASLFVIQGQLSGVGLLPYEVIDDIVYHGRQDLDCGFLEANSKSICILVCQEQQFEQYKLMFSALKQLACRLRQVHETTEHCRRISTLSLQVGRQLRLPLNMLYALRIASYFHDVGNLQIPNDILLKSEPLSCFELKLVQRHAQYGEQVISDLGFDWFEEAAWVIGQHHERIDGSGYPHGLRGNEIHICASILAVTDSFDAMTNEHPYRRSKTASEAIQEIQSLRGIEYHPEVVDAFTAIIQDDL